MNPTVNRSVHYYVSGNSPEEAMRGPFAAIITAVKEGPSPEESTVDLIVFYPGAQPVPKTNVHFSDVPAPTRWSWAPKA